MSYGVNLYLVQFSMIAKNAEQVPTLEVANNLVNSQKFNYSDPEPLSEGRYRIWFYASATDWIDPTKMDKKALELESGVKL